MVEGRTRIVNTDWLAAESVSLAGAEYAAVKQKQAGYALRGNNLLRI